MWGLDGGRQAYETLTILEGTSNMAQQALQANARLKREDTYNLNAYFNKAAIPPFVLEHPSHPLFRFSLQQGPRTSFSP